MALEIERKFMISGFPEELKEVRRAHIWQGYLSIEPEVRIHKALDPANGKENYRLTIKGDGTLTRKEIITDVTKEFFCEAEELLSRPLIYKEFRAYEFRGYIPEVCHVDPGTPDEFYYAEIEFPSEAEATAFDAPAYFGEEVTPNTLYKMKYYWTKALRP